ncbi:MAG: lipid II:glycine glycyltransferase FemX [Thermoplasmata archaeon]
MIREVDTKDWRSFIENAPGGNIFQTPEMAEVFESAERYRPISLFAVENDEIHGLVLATLIWNGGGFMKRFSTRCVLQGGPLFSKASILPILLRELDRLASESALYTEIRNLWDVSSDIPAYESTGFAYEPHLNFHIDLGRGEEELWSDISKGRRKGIKKAERAGLDFVPAKTSSQIDISYEILKKTYSGVGVPLADKTLFESAFRILGPRQYARFFLCLHEGEPIACRAVLSFKGTIHDWYGGSLAEHRAKKPDEFLIWNVLKWGISEGFEVFDFGGAGSPTEDYGPREFKRRFGGKMVEPGRFKKINKPRLLWISGRAYRIYRRLR